MLTRDEIADRLKVSAATVKIWGQHGLLPRASSATTKTNASMSRRARTPPSKCRADVCLIADGPYVLSDQTNEVQYEA